MKMHPHFTNNSILNPNRIHRMYPMHRIHHLGHSSVLETEYGLLECRRGTLREFAIPDPIVWQTVEDWRMDYYNIPFDTLRRRIPRHFTQDQAWMLQWVETSNLHPLPDHTGLVYMQPSKPTEILLYDARTDRLIPLHMNLEHGTLWAEGRVYTRFSQMPYKVTQIWRMEAGTYYRIL